MSVYGEVVRTTWLTPRMVRVVLGGDGLANYTPTPFTDQYVNAQFLPVDAPYAPPFDIDEARALDQPLRPSGRRITVRAWDAARRELSLDFVTHGKQGRAGAWAAAAKAGDRLQFLGPSGAYAPDPDADAHLLVGDESALPAIANALERIPSGKPAHVVGIIDDAEHELDLATDAELHLTWLHRTPGGDDPERIADAVRSLGRPSGRLHCFVHGEAGETRAVRRVLLGEWGITKASASISPYWRRTLTDEEWRTIKRDWMAATERDVPDAS